MSEKAQLKDTQPNDTQPKDSIVRDIFILVVITLVAGLLLGAAYGITKEPIADAQARAKEQAQRSVMQNAESFSVLMQSEENAGEEAVSEGSVQLSEAVEAALADKGITNTSVEQIDAAFDGAGKTTGYVVTASNSEGYGGAVELMCGISAPEDGTLTIEGISFLTLTETAGMGMRAKEESFTQQFPGKMISPGESLVYTKDGAAADNEIDAISGCTVTTNAVTKDINAALEAVRVMQEHPEAAVSADAGREDSDEED